MYTYNLVNDCEGLRKLMLEHPECPIVVLAGEEANSGDWSWTYCSSVHCRMSQILDVETPYDDEDGHVFTDKDEFRDAIMNHIDDAEPDYSGRELEEAVEAEFKKYEKYWHDVIAIFATN